MKILLLTTFLIANTIKLISSPLYKSDVEPSFYRDLNINLNHFALVAGNKTFCVFSDISFEVQISYSPFEEEPEIKRIQNCFQINLTGQQQSTKIEALDFNLIPVSMRKTILFTILILLAAPYAIAFVNQQMSKFDIQ
jgi:hypothetical protein